MSDSTFVHESAIIDQPVRIGAGTKIWCFSHVMAGAEIGRNCVLGQNVVVASRARLGDNVKVQNNVSIYDCVTLEDDVFCGPSCVFTNVMNPRSEFPRKDEYRPTLVRRGATIGANATIVCGVTLGEYCFIGAGAVVTTDIPAFALVTGVPGRHVGWMSRHGRPLHFTSERVPICDEIGDVYRLNDDATVTLVQQGNTAHHRNGSAKHATPASHS